MDALGNVVREAARLPYVITAPVFLERMGFPLYRGVEAYKIMYILAMPFQRPVVESAEREFLRTGKHPAFEFRQRRPIDDAFLAKKRPTWEWSFVYPEFQPRNESLMALPAVYRFQYDRIAEENKRNDRRMTSVWLKYIFALYKTLAEAHAMLPDHTDPPSPADDGIRKPLHQWLTKTFDIDVDEFCTYDEFAANIGINNIPTDVTYFLREPERDIRAQHSDPNSPLSIVEDTVRRRYALIDIPLSNIRIHQVAMTDITKTVPIFLDEVVVTKLFDVDNSVRIFRGKDFTQFEGWYAELQQPIQNLETRILQPNGRDDVIKALIDAVDYRNKVNTLFAPDDLDALANAMQNLATENTLVNKIDSIIDLQTQLTKTYGNFPFGIEPGMDDDARKVRILAIINFVATPFVSKKALPWLEAAKTYLRDKTVPDKVDGQELTLNPPDRYVASKPKNMTNKDFNFFFGISKNVSLMSSKNLQLQYLFAYMAAYTFYHPEKAGAKDLFNRLNSLHLVTRNPNSGYVIRDSKEDRSWLLYQAVTADGAKIRARMRARKRALYAEAKRWKPESEPQPGDEDLKPSLLELLEEAVESGQPLHAADEVTIELMEIDNVYETIYPYHNRLDTFTKYARAWFSWRDTLEYDKPSPKERAAIENVSDTIHGVCKVLANYHKARVSLQNDAIEYQQRRDLWALDRKERVVAEGHQKEQTWADLHTLNEKTAEYLDRACTLYDDDTDVDTGLYIENGKFKLGPLKHNARNLVKVTRYLPDFPPDPSLSHERQIAKYRALFSNFAPLESTIRYFPYLSKVRDVYLTPVAGGGYEMGAEGFLTPGTYVDLGTRAPTELVTFYEWLIRTR